MSSEDIKTVSEPKTAAQKAINDDVLPLVGAILNKSLQPWSSADTAKLAADKAVEAKDPSNFEEAKILIEALRKRVKHLEAREVELAKENRRFQLVMDAAQLGLWDWNCSSGDVVFNHQWKAMLGHEDHEVPDHVDSWSSRVCPDDKESVDTDLAAHLGGKTPYYRNVHRIRHKDGSWRWILDTGRVIEVQPDGSPARATGIHEDVTETVAAKLALQQAKGKAEAALAEKSNMLSHMTHELRTPMVGILGAAGLLQQDQTLSPESRQLSQVMQSSTEFLLDVVNKILDLSKLESGNLRLELSKKVDVRKLVEKVIRMLEVLITKDNKKVRLCWDYPDNQPTYIMGDSLRLQQVLLNLCSNSIKFTKSGSISMSLRFHEGQDLANNCSHKMVISIKDTGIGMTPEQASRIFKPYEQADVSTTRRYGGTGLGLSISKNIVELMGGDISLTSELGKGTTFVVAAPVVCVPEDDKEVVSSPNVDKRFDDTVILAEDNLINAKVQQMVLKRIGIKAIVAHNGKEALDVAQSDQTHSFILMDVDMPLMDGVEATQKLRELGYQKPIIGLTANTDPEDVAFYKSQGINDCLGKPLLANELVRLLKQYARRV